MDRARYFFIGVGMTMVCIGTAGLTFNILNQVHLQSVEHADCLKALDKEVLNIGDNDFNDYTSSRSAWNPTDKAKTISDDENTLVVSCAYLYNR